MHSGDSSLLLLAEAVADGEGVDWDHAESSASSPEERRVVQQLRQLATVATAARADAQSWGPLEIHAEIGRGTFGTVYRARDTRLDREVALKLLHQEGVESPLASTVVKEGRLLAQIRHPNVVTVYGADVFAGHAGLWMEFVSGRTLKEIVEDHGPFGPHEAAIIGIDLSRALAAVHKLGFLHRDVKAQNVMREAGGRTVLMDFGTGDSAAVAAGGSLAGTPAYLSPEVLAGASPSFASDLYSLGVLLFYLVTGEFPVTGRSLAELRDNHAQTRRKLLRDVRPDLPAAFLRVIDRATAPDPKDRPESAGAMEALLVETLALGGDNLSTAGNSRLRPSKTGGGAALRWLAAVVVAVVGVGLAFWPRPARTTPGITPRNSVAVLSFTNLTPTGQESDYFSNGITQDLVAQLATIRNLRIVSGTSVRRYSDGHANPTDIGSALGVATVLEGTVRRSDSRVQITSRLVDAQTGQELWADTFDRDVKDMFSVQSGIARRIAFALRGELTRLETESMVALEERDFEAFDLYLKGREQWELRTEQGLNRSVQYFQDAVNRDPKYALAHAGMADAYTLMGMYGVLPRPFAFSRATAAAERAVALADSLAEGHAALGYVRKNKFEWAAAEESFKRALELKPGYAPAHHWYAIYLTQHGRFPEAIGEIKTAISLDPLSTGANAQFGSILMMARRYDDAIAQFQRTLKLDAAFPAQSSIAQAYTYKGMFEAAYQAMERARRGAPVGSESQPMQGDLGYLLAVSGRSGEALQIARELAERHRRTGEEVAVDIAAVYAGLSARDDAIQWLTEARKYGDLELGYLKVEPRWDGLRDDARFTSLLDNLGLTR